MKSETIMLTIALALAIGLVGGLVVVPAMVQQAEATITENQKNNYNNAKWLRIILQFLL